jgi:hypothetical protein
MGKNTLKESLIIVTVCGITFLFYKVSNPYKDIERFYHSQNIHLYYVLNICYVIIMIALALNIRQVLVALRKKLF